MRCIRVCNICIKGMGMVADWNSELELLMVRWFLRVGKMIRHGFLRSSFYVFKYVLLYTFCF
jgi:hypothetical protein